MDGGRPSVSELSRGEYGARVGLGHVIDLLADFEIPASFFIPAVSALLHLTIVETIQSNQDHEIWHPRMDPRTPVVAPRAR